VAAALIVLVNLATSGAGRVYHHPVVKSPSLRCANGWPNSAAAKALRIHAGKNKTTFQMLAIYCCSIMNLCWIPTHEAGTLLIYIAESSLYVDDL